MRSQPLRLVKPSYRPHLLPLEERLPLGDAVLGAVAGLALLSAHATQPAQPSAAPSISPVGRISNPSARVDGLEIRPTESFTAWSGEATAALTAPVWDALPDLFAPAARSSSRRGLAESGGTRLVQLIAETAPAPLAALAPATPSAPVHARHPGGTLLAMLVGLQTPAPTGTQATSPTQEARVKESLGKLPLSFEQNVGQTDASVQFFTRGPGYGLFLTSTEAVMVLNPPKALADVGAGLQPALADGQVENPSPRTEEAPVVVRMQVLGGNPAPAVTGRDQLPGKVNYFLGNDPAQWHTNVATYTRVEYDEVYPGIDLVYYGNQQQLEYDFVVAPGADPNAIRLGIQGAESVTLDAAGDLVLSAGGQELRQHRPFVYQEVDGVRHPVASRFVLDGEQVRFAVAAYDAGRPLVIDPVLAYSTYVGGSGSDYGIGAVDPITGDILVIGSTASTDFPTANPWQPNYGGGPFDAFVARLSADGSAMLFSTYFGGSSTDYGYGIAVDPTTGNLLITGQTSSTDFPTANPLQPKHGGGRSDAFVARLSADGSALVYSTYLGGSSNDVGSDIAVDPTTGDALVAGQTYSTDFPTANPLQPNLRGIGNAFVARLSADGSALVYSTYLGGSGIDFSLDIAVDVTTGDTLLTGITQSLDFPTANPLQPNYGGNGDAFVARLSADGSALVFSTYLGGSDVDAGSGIAVDPATGDALVTGDTRSTNFPTANPLQPNYGGGVDDAFVARLSADGSALVYSTYLGGNGRDGGGAIVVDPSTGDALVAGYTTSADFPTANPWQPKNGGESDAFVARLSADGSALVFSTYLGGSVQDFGYEIAVDPTTGNVLVAGQTGSTDFPTTKGAFDATCGTDGLCNPDYDKKGNPIPGTERSDAFVSRITWP